MAPSLLLSKKQHHQQRDGVPDLFRLLQQGDNNNNNKVNWSKVTQRASTQPQEAHFVHPETKFTALHKAAMLLPCSAVENNNSSNNKTNNNALRLNAIRALLLANPAAASFPCAQHGYTPLAYACLNQEENPDVIKLILDISPDSCCILSKDGKSPLDLHMKTMSRRTQQQTSINNASQTVPNTDILTALVSSQQQQQQLANNTYHIARALETLFSYNTLRVLEKLALEEAIASLARLQARRQARLLGTSNQNNNNKKESSLSVPTDTDDSTKNNHFDHFWVWQWVVVLLKLEHQFRHSKEDASSAVTPQPPPPFYPLLVASSIKDCPLPILIMAARANPHELRQADSITGNLPLHNVAFWDAQEPDKVSRKSMALTALSREYPSATKIKNKKGKTPLSLALETGTSWDNGVRCLTQTKEGTSAATTTTSSHSTSITTTSGNHTGNNTNSSLAPKREKRPTKNDKRGRSLRTETIKAKQ